MGRLPLLLAFFIASVLYISWRFTTLNFEALTFSVLFLVTEIFTIFSFSVFLVTTIGRHERKAPPPQEGLGIDVFVPTYNEPLHIVRPTLLAAKQLNYPHETWLLDDGNRLEMKDLAKEFGCHYLSRTENLHAKAGNLNNALQHANGEFVLIFDADHVAQPDFINKLLGYFEDEKVSFVQTPQDYFNDNAFLFVNKTKNKFIFNEQRFFFRHILPARDFWNAAYSCGSGCIFRRKHLDEIGGFAVETVTEDIHTTIHLHQRGYKSIYHDEPLCYGLAPQQLMPYLQQRLRWGQGTMRTGRLEHLPFTRELTLGQNLCYLSSMFAFISGWQRLFFYITPIFILLTNILPIRTEVTEYMFVFVPYIVFLIITFKQLTNGYGPMLSLEIDQMASFLIFCFSTFSYFTKKQKFRVTVKSLSGKWSDLFWLIPQMLIILGTIVGIILGTIRFFNNSMDLDMLLVVSFWALLNFSYATVVIKDAVRCLKIKEEKYLFPIPLPVEFNVTYEKTLFTTVEVLNRDKIILKTSNLKTFGGKDKLSGRIFLPDGPISFCGELNENILTFVWKDISHADQLDLSLHDCSWHRLFLGYRMRIKTPSEWLRILFGIATADELQSLGGRFVLFKDARTTKADWLLGGCSASPKLSDSLDLLVWGVRPIPLIIAVRNIDSEIEVSHYEVVNISGLANNMSGQAVHLTKLSEDELKICLNEKNNEFNLNKIMIESNEN